MRLSSTRSTNGGGGGAAIAVVGVFSRREGATGGIGSRCGLAVVTGGRAQSSSAVAAAVGDTQRGDGDNDDINRHAGSTQARHVVNSISTIRRVKSTRSDPPDCMIARDRTASCSDSSRSAGFWTSPLSHDSGCPRIATWASVMVESNAK
ncbi:hypothetical protein BC828DRAFT_390980 [Blastocladiella britannica]|nr:hypothetical protein BC828DRAFT_390980 [Blastocladiella britannica]